MFPPFRSTCDETTSPVTAYTDVLTAVRVTTVPCEPFISALKIEPQIWNGYPPAVALVPSIISLQGDPFGPLMVSVFMMKKAMLSVPLDMNEGATKKTLGEALPVDALKLAFPSKTNATPFVRSAGLAGRSVTPPNGPMMGLPVEVFDTMPPVMLRPESWK